MATTKITSPDLFNLESLNTALKLPSGTTAQRPTSPSTGEWRYNTTTNLVEFWDGGAWRDLQSEDIPPLPSENFNTVLYDGTGSAQSITGVGFKPDWVWIKQRNGTAWNSVFDSTRGAGKRIVTNSSNAENTDIQRLSSFDADGFSLGSDGDVNGSGKTFVAWCWKANGGTTSSNTDGSVTSTVQANTQAGFSVVTATAPASGVFTVGHGLNAEIDLYVIKNTSSTGGWQMYVRDLGANKYIELNATSAAGTSTSFWDNTNPTSSVFTMQSGYVITGSSNFVAYCFKSIVGFSKFSTYTGNGSAAGPIVNTGFEPAFVMVKTASGNNGWAILDNKRNTTNIRNLVLFANSDEAEYTASGGGGIDFLSNGFQVNSTENYLNANGETFIYIAFGSDASAAPALADSFANKLYDGTGSPQSITGLGFSPSLVWLKSRNQANKNVLTDVVRGSNKQLFSDSTDGQSTSTDRITSFDTDGFTLNSGGSFNRTNNSGTTYVAWNWKASPVPTINTDGTIQSVVSASQASGFSIVGWTGDGSASATVGHGLSGTPDFIMLKDLTDIGGWNGAQVGLASNEGIGLQSNAAAFTGMGGNGGITYANLSATNFGFATGSSGVDSVNKNGNQYIAYCWKSVAGFSKMGSYNGSGSDGNVVATGFKPSWVMIKRSNSSGGWLIFDSARSPSNPVNDRLEANNDQAEQTNSGDKFLDFNATDFEANGSDSELNASGGTYIYMAYKANLTPYPLAGNMSFLVIAGGASGGNENSRSGGGGGAGGLRTSYGPTSGGGSSAESDITLAAGTYTITIGAGGAGQSSTPGAGNAGSLSSLAASSITTISSVGGGTGGAPNTGGSGGSGGGGAHGGNAGGSGTANQGFAGGSGNGESTYNGGGGGGASQVGVNSSASAAGAGGDGVSVSITGSATTYAGGGGGGGGTSGSGGAGGGSAGSTGTAGGATVNTGGGGGGARSGSGAGGSGVAILRLLTSEYSSSTTGSPTVTTDGDYTILTYTGSGTYVHS